VQLAAATATQIGAFGDRQRRERGLAVGGHHQFHDGAVFVQSLEHTAGAERLVVRMRRHHDRSVMVLVGKGAQFR
jgi:hypothetical protein